MATAKTSSRTTRQRATDVVPVVVPESAEPVRHAPMEIKPYQATLPAPMLRAGKMGLMVGQMMTRSLCNQMTSASVLPTALDGDTLSEIVQIQQAIYGRMQKQQTAWVQGVQNIAQEYHQLHAANTMSKFVEQEYNVMAQFSDLLSRQLTSWVGLMENIQVDYAYWISEKVSGTSSS